jgi:uncharacterized protein (DUF2147 family)
MRSRLYSLSAFVCLIIANAALADQNEPTGMWLTQAGDAKVWIARCGSSICGTIVWLKQPIDNATGKPQIDDKNPDPTKARRPIIGLNLFLGMKSEGTKWSGRIYNADNGQTYASNVSLVSPKALKVEGCVLMFCGSETWTKLPDPQTAMAQ